MVERSPHDHMFLYANITCCLVKYRLPLKVPFLNDKDEDCTVHVLNYKNIKHITPQI